MQMNLLFISSTYPHPRAPHRGAFNRDMIDALAQHCETRVVSPIPWKERVWRSAPLAEPQVKSLGSHPTLYPTYYYTPKLARSLYGNMMYRSVRQPIRRFLHNWRPDVVLGYWAHPDGEVACRLANDFDASAVTIVGGSDVRVLAQQPSRGRVIRKVLRRSDHIISVSDELRTQLHRLQISDDKISVIHRGVNQRLFHPGSRRAARERIGCAAETKLLLWAGRMVDVKRPDRLLAAVPRIRQQLAAPLQLAMLGDGPLKTLLETSAREQGIDDVVIFPGPQSHHQMADWYRAADLVVMTSESEGIPNVLREAKACGTPFLSTNVGGISELAEPLQDVLIEPFYLEEFAKAVCSTLTRPSFDCNKNTSIDTHSHMADKLAKILAEVHLNKRTGIDQQQRLTSGKRTAVGCENDTTAGRIASTFSRQCQLFFRRGLAG